MGQPRFRNPDKYQVLPYREWLRHNQPGGEEGYVVEDLDLLLRGYGPRYQTDPKGKFLLCELKFYPARINRAQRMTFGLLDEVARLGDPEGMRYKGYYVVQYDNEDWDQSRFWVNGVAMNREEFLRFSGLDPQMVEDIPSFEF